MVLIHTHTLILALNVYPCRDVYVGQFCLKQNPCPGPNEKGINKTNAVRCKHCLPFSIYSSPFGMYVDIRWGQAFIMISGITAWYMHDHLISDKEFTRYGSVMQANWMIANAEADLKSNLYSMVGLI